MKMRFEYNNFESLKKDLAKHERLFSDQSRDSVWYIKINGKEFKRDMILYYSNYNKEIRVSIGWNDYTINPETEFHLYLIIEKDLSENTDNYNLTNLDGKVGLCNYYLKFIKDNPNIFKKGHRIENLSLYIWLRKLRSKGFDLLNYIDLHKEDSYIWNLINKGLNQQKPEERPRLPRTTDDKIMELRWAISNIEMNLESRDNTLRDILCDYHHGYDYRTTFYD